MLETFSSSAREHERIFPLRTLGIFVLWLLLLFRVVDGFDKNVLLWFLYFFFACLQREKLLSHSNGRTHDHWKEEQTKNENIILYSIVLVINK